MEHTNQANAKVNFRGIELSDYRVYFFCHHCGAKLKWYRDAWEDVPEKEWDQYGISRKESQSVRFDLLLASDADSDKKASNKSVKQKRKRDEKYYVARDVRSSASH